VRDVLLPVVADPVRRESMAGRAAELGVRDADERLADLVTEAAGSRR
jgi:UDP-N-acetylglucosamine--N-acetylmuramyl-(pentapeptide) pyrophosphoryl-undecaprenol N-acetylglucosamine transferase